MVWIGGSRRFSMRKDVFKLRLGRFKVKAIAGLKPKLKKSLAGLLNRRKPCGKRMEIQKCKISLEN